MKYKIIYFDNKAQKVIEKKFKTFSEAEKFGKKTLSNFNFDMILPIVTKIGLTK